MIAHKNIIIFIVFKPYISRPIKESHGHYASLPS